MKYAIFSEIEFTPRTIAAFCLTAVILVVLVARALFSTPPPPPIKDSLVILNGKVSVHVEVADTPETRQMGLSGRPPLAEDEGMLFIFPAKGLHGFWMKDMLFPIDIIWIADERIIDISHSVPKPVPGYGLPTFAPKSPVDRVLEVQAGFAEKRGLKAGMTADIRLTRKDR